MGVEPSPDFPRLSARYFFLHRDHHRNAVFIRDALKLRLFRLIPRNWPQTDIPTRLPERAEAPDIPHGDVLTPRIRHQRSDLGLGQGTAGSREQRVRTIEQQ